MNSGDKAQTRTSVGPKDHVVIVGVTPALKKVEEQVAGLNVDVTGICAILAVSCILNQQCSWAHLTPSSQKLLFLMRTS
jgi:hypothetical protein